MVEFKRWLKAFSKDNEKKPWIVFSYKDQNCLDISSSALEILGGMKQHWLGKNIRAFVTSDFKDLIDKYIPRFMEEKNIPFITYSRLKCYEGNPIAKKLKTEIFYENDKKKCIKIYIEEYPPEELWGKFLENPYNMVFIHAYYYGKWFFMNDYGLKLLGYNRDKLLKLKVKDILTEESFTKAQDDIRKKHKLAIEKTQKQGEILKFEPIVVDFRKKGGGYCRFKVLNWVIPAEDSEMLVLGMGQNLDAPEYEQIFKSYGDEIYSSIGKLQKIYDSIVHAFKGIIGDGLCKVTSYDKRNEVFVHRAICNGNSKEKQKSVIRKRNGLCRYLYDKKGYEYLSYNNRPKDIDWKCNNQDSTYGNIVILPLRISGDELIGHVCVQTNWDFDENDALRKAALNFVTQASAAIDHTNHLVKERLFNQLRKNYDLAENLENYLVKVLDMIIEELKIDGCSIYIHDVTKGDFYLAATSGIKGQDKHNIRLKRVNTKNLDHFLVGSSHLSMKCYQFLSEFPESSIERSSHKGFLCCSIMNPAGTDVLGIIKCVSKRPSTDYFKPAFYPEDIEILGFIANVLGVFIEIANSDAKKAALLMNNMHDIKSRINLMKGMADVLIRCGDQFPPGRKIEMLNSIKDGCISSQTLLDRTQVLGDIFLKESPLSLKRCSLSKMVREVVDSIRSEMRIKGMLVTNLNYVVPNHLPDVYLDEKAFKQVLQNLLLNSVKYMGRKENFSITIEADYDKEAGVELRIRDNSIGIEPEYKERIFEDGFRTPKAMNLAIGSGLGCFIARKIVEAHGGSIILEKPANPTVFLITLPKEKVFRGE